MDLPSSPLKERPDPRLAILNDASKVFRQEGDLGSNGNSKLAKSSAITNTFKCGGLRNVTTTPAAGLSFQWTHTYIEVRGSPERGYFALVCVWSGRQAGFVSWIFGPQQTIIILRRRGGGGAGGRRRRRKLRSAAATDGPDLGGWRPALFVVCRVVGVFHMWFVFCCAFACVFVVGGWGLTSIGRCRALVFVLHCLLILRMLCNYTPHSYRQMPGYLYLGMLYYNSVPFCTPP